MLNFYEIIHYFFNLCMELEFFNSCIDPTEFDSFKKLSQQSSFMAMKMRKNDIQKGSWIIFPKINISKRDIPLWSVYMFCAFKMHIQDFKLPIAKVT